MGQVGTGWTGTSCIVGIEPVPGQGQASSVGIEPVSGTGTGLQRGYMTCLWDRDRSLLIFSCPSGKFFTGLHSTLSVPPFQSRHLTKSRVFPYQKTKGEIPYQKLVSNWSKIETKGRENFV